MNHKLVQSISKNTDIYKFQCLFYKDVLTYILYCIWGENEGYIWGSNISSTVYSDLITGRIDFYIFLSLIIFDTPWVFSYCMVLWCTKGQNIFISAQSFLPTVFASGNIASRCWIRKKQLYGNPPYWMVIELDESLKTKKFLGPKEI